MWHCHFPLEHVFMYAHLLDQIASIGAPSSATLGPIESPLIYSNPSANLELG